MILLAIDTSGREGGVLLARGGIAGPRSPHDPETVEVLGTATLRPREFSRELLAGVEDVLRAGRIRLADVDCLAVASGPGSFTGLRVGLSAVKALAEVVGTPVVALSTLAVLASKAARATGSEADDSLHDRVHDRVHAVMDAGRGEFYHGVYRDAGNTCAHESLDTLAALAESLCAMPGLLTVQEFPGAEALAALGHVRVENLHVADAVPLALAAWRSRRFVDVALLDANYLRRMEPVVKSAVPAGPNPVE